MPEQVSQLIPTQEELRLRESEPKSWLLGKTIDDLVTRGSRLSFKDEAEDQAHTAYASLLAGQARELINNSPLNFQERQELLGLVDTVANDFTTLRKKIETLRIKYATQPAKAETKSDMQGMPSETVKAITIDLSEVNTAEAFVPELISGLGGKTDDELVAISCYFRSSSRKLCNI